MKNNYNNKRLQTLENNIDEILDLINQYEEKRWLSDDPREQRNGERQIADLLRLLKGYQTELYTLQKKFNELQSQVSETPV